MEYRKRCKVCGKIFCYTDADLKSNKTNATMGAISGLATIAGVLSGNMAGALVNDHLGNRSTSKIIDYNKCPYCGSSLLEDADLYNNSVVTPTLDTMQNPSVMINANASTESLTKRIKLFINDEEWAKADAYCENLLDREPENAEIYFLKFLATHHKKSIEELEDKKYLEYIGDRNYQKALGFSSGELKDALFDYERGVNKRKAILQVNALSRKNDLTSKFEALELINNHKDIQEFEGKGEKLAEDIKKTIENKISSATAETVKRIVALCDSEIEKAPELFEGFDYKKKSEERIQFLEKKEAEERETRRIKAEELRKREEERKAAEEKSAKKRRVFIIVGAIALVIIIAYAVAIRIIIPNNNYNKAVRLKESGKYQNAIEAFEEMNGYKDSEQQIKECNSGIQYEEAIELMNDGNYQEAITVFRSLDDFRDSYEMINKIEELKPAFFFFF